MPVSNPDVVDGIGVDQVSAAVVLAMYEERNWDRVDEQLQDLEHKISTYVRFVSNGQINDHAEYVGRSVQIELYCQFVPPSEKIRTAFQAIRKRLQIQSIKFRVFVG